MTNEQPLDIDDAGDEPIDTDDGIGDYFGQDAVDPLNRAIDARIEAAAQAKSQTTDAAPKSAPDRDAVDDATLDAIIDGNVSEASRLQQRPPAPPLKGFIP